MKKTFFRAIKKFFAAMALVSLAACSDLSVDSDDAGSPVAKGEKATVTFNLSTPDRTVYPKITLSDYAYKITVDSGDAAAATLSDSKLSAEVEAGEHTFKVEAFAKDTDGAATGNAILTGSKTATISTSEATVSIVLVGVTGENLTGTISATLNLGTEIGAATYKVGVGASLPVSVPEGDAVAINDNKITYFGTAASGTTQYVVFFLYNANGDFICPYTFPMYAVSTLTTSAEETLTTATFTATVTVTKDSEAWNDSGLEVTLVNASDSSDTITMTSTAGTNTYTANANDSKTYKVYVGGIDKGLTITKDSSSATIAYTSNVVFPNMGATSAYADTYFEITFDAAPTINRASTGTVRIYKADGTLVDTIKPAAETMYGYGYGGNSGLGSINVQYQLIQVVDTNKVRIIPHHNTSTGLTLLENKTAYYIVVDDGIIDGTINTASFKGIAAGEWTFTTGAAPSVSNNTLTVGTDKNFITVQGAFSYLMKESKTGDWTINIDTGTYYERLFYRGSANITMSGQTTTEYGTDVEIQWCNQDGGEGTTLWNYGSRGRNVFYYAGGNLVLENLSIINTATRKTNEYGEHDATNGTDTANGKNQAEALMFDSKGNCAAYNCNFTSKQDTIYLSPAGGKAWFYGCKISGDVDFIWGESDVALFEECNIIAAYDSEKTGTQAAYVVASRLANSTDSLGKGFVVYNSTITTESGQTTYLARSPWGSSDSKDSQVAIIDTAVTGGLQSDPWDGTHKAGSDETILGWKWYGVTSGGSAISATNQLSSSQYEAEYAGRRNIINRVYNGTAFEKDSVSNWDINALATARNWNVVEDTSKETLDGETEVTSVVWETSKASLAQTKNKTFYMYTDLATTETAPTGDDLYNYLYCDGSANDYIQGSLELYGTAAIYVPVKTNSTATIAFTQGAGTLTVAGTDYTASASVTVDCSSATLATLNGIKYVEVRVKGTAGGTGDKWYVTNIAVTTVEGSSSSDDTDTISASDVPTGYAGVDYTTNYGSTSYTEVTATNASEFKNFITSSTPYIINVSGEIDLSEGYMPTTAGGTSDLLDALVLKVSTTDDTSSAYDDYSTYAAWKAAYVAACDTSTNDKNSDTTKLVWKLNEAYQQIVKVNVTSNKIIIGDGTAVIKGGLLNISSKENIIIRNVTLQDAYDPFPHHEENDGYNAELDCICIQGTSKYIWIDHCTLQDTLGYTKVSTGGTKEEKWQTFDGLIDMKNTVSNITVSYCKITNHDKTMLIGNTDSDGSNSTRTITLHHNYFYNCGQRLPMVRNSTIHIYNNYYDADSETAIYSQQYAIGPRAGSIVYSENNYFGSGIGNSFKVSDNNTAGTYYESGSSDKSSGASGVTSSGETLFSSTVNAYSYTVDTVSAVANTTTGVPAKAGVIGGNSSSSPSNPTVTFTPATDSSTANNVDTLGLVGVSVAPTGDSGTVANAVIEEGKIKVTSKAEGTETITVTDSNGKTATFKAIVAEDGSIVISSITKYVVAAPVKDTDFAVTELKLTANATGLEYKASDAESYTAIAKDAEVTLEAGNYAIRFAAVEGAYAASADTSFTAAAASAGGTVSKYELDFSKLASLTVGTKGTFTPLAESTVFFSDSLKAEGVKWTEKSTSIPSTFENPTKAMTLSAGKMAVSSSKLQNAVKIVTTGAATLTAYVTVQAKGNALTLDVYNSGNSSIKDTEGVTYTFDGESKTLGTEVEASTANSDGTLTLHEITVTLPTAGTYYLGDTNKGKIQYGYLAVEM